jgi:hypothetical protein
MPKSRSSTHDERGAAVDAAGAEMLAWRIEQHSHWRQAQSVLDGRQPATDPDRADLVSVGDGIRIYSQSYTFNGSGRLCKRLVNGIWEHGSFDEPPKPPDDADIYGDGAVADIETASRPEIRQIARVAY